MQSFKYIFFVLLAAFLSACNLQQQIDLELPEYEPEVVVESYLIPGQPFVVTLSRSVAFFDTLEVQFVEGATVTLTWNNKTDTLVETDVSDLLSLVDSNAQDLFGPLLGNSPKLYLLPPPASFINVVPSPDVYPGIYTLRVETREGDTLTSETFVPRQLTEEERIEEILFNEDTLALLLSRVQDNVNETNFYRRLLQHRRGPDTARRTSLQQDFVLDDAFSNGELITFGTGYEYDPGDTLISYIYHITGDYYEFVETRDDALAASLSPFAQPAIIYTNVEGGQGIFTGLSFTRDTVFIPE